MDNSSKAFLKFCPLGLIYFGWRLWFGTGTWSILETTAFIGLLVLALHQWSNGTPHRSLLEYWCLWHLRRWQASLPERMRKQDIGLLWSRTEMRLEKNRLTVPEGEEDGVTITGVEEGGCVFYLRLSRRAGRKATAHLTWRDKSIGGESYNALTNWSLEVANAETSSEATARAGGICLTVLEPFRRIRILFNGMMKRASDGQVVHVRMNCIWCALDEPFDLGKDSCLSHLARTAADMGIQSTEQLKKLSEDVLSGIDQFGVVYGKAIVGEDNEQDIYVRGLRQKTDPDAGSSTTSLFPTATFIGVSDNGFHFSLRLQERPSSSYVGGFLYVPGGNGGPMSEINFPFGVTEMLKAWQKGILRPQQRLLKFKACGRWYNASLVLSDRVKSGFNSGPFLHPSWHEQYVIPADITLNASRGRGLFIFSLSLAEASRGVLKEESYPLLAPPQPYSPQNPSKPAVISLEAPEAKYSELSGGKGASLALMLTCQDLAKKAEVPKGVVVTVKGYLRQVKSSQALGAALDELEQTANAMDFQSDSERREALEKKCEWASDVFATTQVEESLAKEIAEELSAIFGEGWEVHKRLAVRSSAIGEDSDEVSAAGQNETFLGCRGLEGIRTALAKCWASLLKFQSVEYRRQSGQPIRVPMAVVIQEMVAADCAGVLFTRDPVNGSPERMVINANYGLGESVVSASCDPDSIHISYRPWSSEKFAVEEKKVGSKLTKVVMDEKGGVLEKPTDGPSDAAALSCLSDDTCLRLAQIGAELEQRFGGSRDVEFALSSDKIFLLQSRPVTSFEAWTEDELIRELDDAIPSDQDLHSRANVGEVIGCACTELTQTTWPHTIERILQKSTMGKVCPYTRRVMRSVCKHEFFNYGDTLCQMVESRDVPLISRVMDISVCGHEVIRPEDLDLAIARRGIATRWRKLKFMLVFFQGLVKCTYATFFGLPAPNIVPSATAKSSLRTIHGSLMDVIRETNEPCQKHCDVSNACTGFQMVLFQILSEGSSEWTNDLNADVTRLLISDEEESVLSAGIPSGLRAIALALSGCPEVESNFVRAQSTSEAEEWLKKQPEVSKLFRDFMQKYHHRCIMEFELTSIPWGEDSAQLIESLQAGVAGILSQNSRGGTSETTRKRETFDEKILQLSKPISKGTERSLRFFTWLAGRGTALREQTKSNFVAHAHKLRQITRTLGLVLRKQGVLPREGLVFHLTLNELDRLVCASIAGGGDSALVQKAVKRERLRTKLADIRFDEMTYGVPKPVAGLISAPAPDFDADGCVVVRGTPACRGVYQGLARVVIKLQEAKSIQQGEVLITVGTDIGWSPYFPILGGVITELGGLLSHGAVVSREYGLPCVVGATGVTNVFKTGDIVQINGKDGTITKVRGGLA